MEGNKEYLLIGLSGKMKSGKTTAAKAMADMLKEQYGLTSYYLSIGTYIKQMVENTLLIRMEDNSDVMEKHFGYRCADDPHWRDFTNAQCAEEYHDGVGSRTLGTILQEEGDKLRRDDEDYWVNQALRDVRRELLMGVIFIDGVRHPSDAEAIKKKDGIVIRINRNGVVDKSRSEKHISETVLDYYTFDGYIYVDDDNNTNNKDLLKVCKTADEILCNL